MLLVFALGRVRNNCGKMPVTQSGLQPNGHGFLTNAENVSCMHSLLRLLHFVSLLTIIHQISLVKCLVGAFLVLLLGNVTFSFSDQA